MSRDRALRVDDLLLRALKRVDERQRLAAWIESIHGQEYLRLAVERKVADTIDRIMVHAAMKAAPGVVSRRVVGAPATIDRKAGTVEAVVSREAVARDGILLRLSGLDTSAYMRSPVLMVGHDYADVTRVVGRCERLWIDGAELRARFRFAIEHSQLARQIYDLVAAGFARAFSISWRSLRAVTASSPASELSMLTPTERQALIGGEASAVVTAAELLEISIVGVPGDSSALAL